MTKTENLFEGLSVQDMISDDAIPVIEKPVAEPVNEPVEPQIDEPAPTVIDEPADEPADEPDDNSDSILGSLKSKFGYDFGDQQFEESVDGVFELSRIAAERMADARLDEFFKEMPDVADYAEYRANGGDPAAYFEMVSQSRDYTQTNMSEKDTMTQKHVVGELLRRQGFDDETRETMIASMEESGVLFNQAKAALPVLAKLTNAEKKNLIASQEQAAREAQQRQREEVENIKSLVKVGTIKGIQIPEAEKTKFGAWLMQAGKDGVTPRNAAREKLTLEDKLALEYLVYKGFNLSDVVQKRVETAKAKDLKSLLKDKQGNRMKNDSAQREALNIPNVRDLFG